MSSERASSPPTHVGAQFTPTHWSVVLASREAGSTRAADLTQSFFAHLLGGEFLQRARRDKGRFRNYLLGAMNRFLRDDLNAAHGKNAVAALASFLPTLWRPRNAIDGSLSIHSTPKVAHVER
jgi:hypothetical protein